jgi:hypothetical protein
MVMILTVIMLTGFVFWVMHFFDSPTKKSLLIMPIFFFWPIVFLFILLYALAINIGNKKGYINDKHQYEIKAHKAIRKLPGIRTR